MENKPRFRKVDEDQAHFLRIGQLVKEKLNDLPENNHPHSAFKIFSFPAIYFIAYFLGLYYRFNAGVMISAYAVMGLTGIFLYLNLFHEATHGLLFRSKKSNRNFLNLFDLLGPNSFIWIKRHNKLHHNYPNVHGWDSDIEQSGPLQIFPHQAPEKYNKLQHLYVFLLYPLYLFNWIFIRDFRDFFQHNRVVSMFHPIPRTEYAKLFFFKTVYIGYTVLLPVWLGVPVWQALVSLIALTVAGSILALMVLLTPHVNVSNNFPVISPDGQINSSWFMHQLSTTNDIRFDNWASSCLMGNFHYHVVHHLFPNISYVYAPGVTEILERYSKENGLPYRRYGLLHSLRLHYRLVRQNAVNATEIFSEDL
ncbi:fatty acid desaturase family protein [Flavihumibacter stibioxidans]|uniref:Fatty acid desaturase domain-containing protein n=1 Tax=Flavihumibacter stibioxidans TaxID=1834163 RepID=A0ABR7M5V7_9BACT|nr:fatty acid desaturase [Flavihumibacter stibioxidans]MBC6490011.1 hypothetical protein [Flavihumibacter stibioxidans]